MNYKLIIFGNNMYKEFVLDEHFKGVLTMGTKKDCQICFQRERFLVDFVIQLERQINERFVISCSNTVYFRKGNELKDYMRQLRAGDRLVICYHDTEAEFFYIDFVFDFESVGNDYNLAIDWSRYDSIRVGGTSDCRIRIDDPNLSNDCVSIRCMNGGYQINATHTEYGICVNGFATREAVSQLHNGEFFSLKGYNFNIRSGVLYTTKNAVVFTDLPLNKIDSQKNYLKYPKFKRNVRQRYVLPNETREILKPKAKDESEEQNIILTFMPVLINLILMIVLRGIMGGNAMFMLYFAGTMLVSTTMSVIKFVSDKKKRKAKEVKREDVYMKYILEQEEAIKKLRKEETVIANQMHPQMDEYMTFIEDFDSRLFEKEKSHEDYLSIRIGSGIVPSSCQISYKQEEYVETDDDLMEYPKLMHDKYQYLDNMPILLSLKDTNAVGFIGARTKLYQMEKNLIIEFAASHFYKDVKLFLVMDEDDVPMFEWARWLQNTYNDVTDTRNYMYDKASAKISLEFLYSELSRREAMGNVSGLEDYIILVYKSEVISDHPVSEYISKAKDLKFHFIFFEEHEELLNSECTKRIFLNARDYRGYIQDVRIGQDIQEFHYSHVSKEKVEAAAKRLACVYVDEVNLENSLTKNITLFELLDILNPYDLDLTERWRQSKIFESMAAPLGVKSGNEIVYLDLHEKYHGPHGLVAGTTGSGKSEIMQSYILSMATLFHPYEVGFIIIDFKGGGMANQFKDLPHLIGTITNIDGKEIERSLMSIKAELIKRQELFAEQNVNHINDYIQAYRAGKAQMPLPHLILIVDEFAELKSDQPEFMKELISAARIGRSLGVHLILATQKPSGVVNDQIWSNSKFRLCLKVQNKSDSNEVLKSPLAAEIREPGRAYLQVGNDEIFQLFQSAYSGAMVQNDDISKQRAFKISKVELSGQRKVIYEQKPEKNVNGETQLVSMINYIHDYCKSHGIQKLPNICLPPLSDNIPYTLSEYRYDGTDIVIPVGIVDDPERQQQYIETFNFSQNNYLILGSSQSGKTNLLQIILRGLTQLYSSQRVQLYILDFASMILKNFENLNHIGGIITMNTEERLKGFIKIIQTEIQMRKNLLSRMGLSSYSSYLESGMTDLPQVVILLDNWIGFKNTFAEYEDAFVQISRECVAVGISLVVTVAQASGIGYKFLSNFSKRVALYCNDSSDYNMVFESCRRKLDNVSGRGIIEKNKKYYECQFYHSFAAEKEFEKIKLIQTYIQDINQKNAEFRVKRIPEIPEIVTERFLVEQYGERIFNNHKMLIGMEFSSVDIRSLDLASMFCIGLVGGEKSGRVEYVKYIVSKLINEKSSEIYILDDISGKLNEYADEVLHYTTDVEEMQVFLVELLNKLTQRKQLLEKGTTVMEKEPLEVVIINSADLAKVISKDKKSADVFMTIMNTYKNLNVCFLFTELENARVSIGAGDILKSIGNMKHYLIFENIQNVEIYEASMTIKREYKKALEYREAYYISGDNVEKIRTVAKDNIC